MTHSLFFNQLSINKLIDQSLRFTNKHSQHTIWNYTIITEMKNKILLGVVSIEQMNDWKNSKLQKMTC